MSRREEFKLYDTRREVDTLECEIRRYGGTIEWCGLDRGVRAEPGRRRDEIYGIRT